MNKTIYLLGLCTLATGIQTGCQSNQSTSEGERETVPAIDSTALDRSVRPQGDFYRFTNGGWMAANPLKGEYSRYGAFDILRDSSLAITHDILRTELNGAEAGSEGAKAKALYDMAMDSTKLNADGAKPILSELERIDAIGTKDELVHYLAQRSNEGFPHLFTPYVNADEKNSDMNILSLYQTGLIMGDKSYYEDNAAFAKYQDEYRKFISKLYSLSGVADPDKMAAKCYDTEKSLAGILYSKEELRDTERNYNKVDTTTFFRSFTFPWSTYFAERDGLAGNFKELNVAQYDYFKRFDKWYAQTPLEDIKNLLKAYTISEAAPYLSDDFRKASWEFNGKTMTGAKEMKPRWKSAVAMVENHMGEVIGKVYVEKHFPPEAKDRMIKLIDNLKSALSERINALEWMSAETKEKAQEKLGTFTVKVGYPDKWEDYSKIQVVDSSLYDYIRSINKFETDKNIADLNKPVDKDKWFMTPQTVNAYYNPTTNEICFPAGILQPPFFNMDADDAVNYGAIGVVIGHEITHGFDDQGSKYDKDGNMVNWWTKEDAAKFEQATSKLADQYSNIVVADGLNANGKLTLGENIADQGGLMISFQALNKALEGKQAETIDGWTPAQRFFIAYGRIWGQNIRPEEMVRLTKIDPHSLGEFRVNQALKNIPAFYEAFDVQPGDPMYLAPEDRVLVW